MTDCPANRRADFLRISLEKPFKEADIDWCPPSADFEALELYFTYEDKVRERKVSRA